MSAINLTITIAIIFVVIAIIFALVKEEITFKPLGNGQVLVTFYGDEEFLFNKIEEKYGKNYKIVSTSSNMGGKIVSLILEVG